MNQIREAGKALDIVIHSVAFSSEVQNPHLEVSRQAYLQAMSISSYSLVALSRAALPLMEGRQGSVIGLSYLAGQRVVPYYGGGMATAKAALESDARNLAWFLGEKGHRVNIVSPGPFGSRAARSIGDIDAAVDHAAAQSPLKRSITRDDVANTVLFLASPLSSAITGSCIFVDAGYNIMAAS